MGDCPHHYFAGAHTTMDEMVDGWMPAASAAEAIHRCSLKGRPQELLAAVAPGW
jgi:hypothetical protein